MQLALEKKERLSPSPCIHTASMWGEGTFCLDREFSKNAPLYKQKIIFHLVSSDKMSQKKFFFAWTVDQWYYFPIIFHSRIELWVKIEISTFEFTLHQFFWIKFSGPEVIDTMPIYHFIDTVC